MVPSTRWQGDFLCGACGLAALVRCVRASLRVVRDEHGVAHCESSAGEVGHDVHSSGILSQTRVNLALLPASPEPTFPPGEDSVVTGKGESRAVDAGDALKPGQRKTECPHENRSPDQIVHATGRAIAALGDLAAQGTNSPPVGFRRPAEAGSPIETRAMIDPSTPGRTFGTHWAQRRPVPAGTISDV